jgi:hypothetical protein
MYMTFGWSQIISSDSNDVVRVRHFGTDSILSIAPSHFLQTYCTHVP